MSDTKLTLNTIPTMILLELIEYVPTPSLFNLRLTCKGLLQLIDDERLWKQRCLTDFPWFFWTGKCESTLSVYVGSIRSVKQIVPITEEAPTLETLQEPRFGPVTDGDLGFQCPEDCRVIRKNPYHPLPDSYQEAYKLIYLGKYTGYLQVLNSLNNREMSAFFALATYDRESNSFALCYNEQVIGRYRRKSQVILQKEKETRKGSNEGWIDEEISLNDRVRFRRIPASILDTDPRELYARDLFNMPVTRDGRPLLRPGDEIEVQWRSEPFPGETLHAFAWWRGYVANCYLAPGYLEDTESLIELPNAPFDETLPEGILIDFPHYPEESAWRTAVASIFGVESVGQFGLVGGLRKIECASHRMQWKLLYPSSVQSIIQNQS